MRYVVFISVFFHGQLQGSTERGDFSDLQECTRALPIVMLSTKQDPKFVYRFVCAVKK